MSTLVAMVLKPIGIANRRAEPLEKARERELSPAELLELTQLNSIGIAFLALFSQLNSLKWRGKQPVVQLGYLLW